MTILAIVAGSLILYFALATPTALFIGRMVKLADSQTPPVGTVGEAPPDRRAHLRVVP